MARKQHKYHYIYKTTCSITGRYYIGMHSTSNLEDGYLGSGRRLWLSINKHGKENHKKEILEFLENRQELKDREHQLVNDDALKDPMCMNLQPGGGGGICNEELGKKFLNAGTIASAKSGKCKERMRELLTDETWASKYKQKMSESLKGKQAWLGKSHTSETKSKMSQSHKCKNTGSNNSQFGTVWITNSIENKKIKKTDPIPEHWKIGRKLKIAGIV